MQGKSRVRPLFSRGGEIAPARPCSGGLAGCSIEDWGGEPAALYDRGLAVERVAAAAVSDEEQIAALVTAVAAPLNVLFLPGTPDVARLAELGVARISVGGAFHLASLAALESAAREWQEKGTHAFWPQALVGAKLARRAFD